MTSDSNSLRLSPHIRDRLGALRWRIRAYVCVEGLALVVVWLGLMFWIGFAIDYVPVLLGYYLPSVIGLDEMTQVERIVLLSVVGLVAAWILYRWVFRRAFVRLADHSMAVLLERQFADEHDSLLTAVEMSETPSHAQVFNSDMLGHAAHAAESELEHVRLRRVFRHYPIWRNLIAALVVAGSVIAFGVFNKEVFAKVSTRLFGLSDELYERRAKLEMLRVEVYQTTWQTVKNSTAQVAGDNEKEKTAGQYEKKRRMVPKSFLDKTVTVARGSSPVLKVGADMTYVVVPDDCKIRYETAEGYGDSDKLERRKDDLDEGRFRVFSYRKRPLKGIRSDIKFEIIGGDHRLSGYTIKVVDSPAISSAKLHCERPQYTGLPPLTIGYAPGLKLPLGTKVVIEADCNKPLERAQVYDPASGKMEFLAREQLDGSQLRHEIEDLDANLGLEITLVDQDGVTADEPYHLTITAVEDLPPEVKVVLKGIGTTITSDARLPATGMIGDDYGVNEANFELHMGDDPVPYRFPVELAKDGGVDAAVDLREARSREEDPFTVKPDDKLILAIRASDKCDIGNGPNLGSSERYKLDVVTPEELLARLDAKEIGQRQRFEQILEEMRRVHGDLLRVRADLMTDGDEPPAGAEPEDTADSSGAEPDDRPLDEMSALERASSLRLLMVQRAILQSDKSARELAGVATTFSDIREELINNRVDTEERKRRLKELISDPIDRIVDELFTELSKRLVTLESDLNSQGGSEASADAVDQIELVLLEMENVLAQMLDLETYNELIEIVRELIKEQENLLQDTKKEHKRRLLGI